MHNYCNILSRLNVFAVLRHWLFVMFKIAKDILHNTKWLALKKKITHLALLQINFNTFHMFLVILMKCTVCLVFL